MRFLRFRHASRAIVVEDLWGRNTVSTDVPAALASEAAETEIEAEPSTREWMEAALAALFAATAVLVVSLLAVLANLT